MKSQFINTTICHGVFNLADLFNLIFVIKVKCSVSAQYLVDSGPSPASLSPSFLAGVTVKSLSMNYLLYLGAILKKKLHEKNE